MLDCQESRLYNVRFSDNFHVRLSSPSVLGSSAPREQRLLRYAGGRMLQAKYFLRRELVIEVPLVGEVERERFGMR